MRRRERRLRLWLRHERMTVAMALAENLHHSRQKVEGGEHDGPRAQKTARATGARPGVLTEPEPQVGAVTVGYVAAPVPLVSSPIGGWRRHGRRKKDEEEKARVRRQREAAEHEARMRELDRRVQNDVPLTPAESRAWMRWAGHLLPKKRKKRKLPRNSSRPRLAARHLGRYGPEGHLCRDTETASVARAVRTWKPGLSTSHWYLAPCSVPVMPEEHRKNWSFLGVHYAELFLRPLVSGLLASTLQELRILRSCSSSSVVDILFVPQRQIPMVQTVQQTTEIPQMPFVFRWSMLLLCLSCLPHPLLSTTGAQGSDSAENRRGPAVAVHQGRFHSCWFAEAQCLSSVVHVVRQSTECMNFRLFLREKVDYGS